MSVYLPSRASVSHSRSLFAGRLAVICVLASSPCSGLTSGGRPHQTAPASPPPGVRINDSLEAMQAIRRAENLRASGAWSDAAQGYRRILEKYADKLVPHRDWLYISVADFVNRRIATWPAEGLDAYRRLYEPMASRLVETAKSDRDVTGALSVVESFFCTQAAVDAAGFAAQRGIESGDFAFAAALYEELLTYHPDRSLRRAELAGKLGIALALSGRKDPATRLRDELRQTVDRASIRWMGVDRSPVAIIDELLSRPFGTGTPPARFAWPSLGGDLTGSRVIQSAAEAETQLWSLSVSCRGVMDRPAVAATRDGQSEVARNGLPGFCPVIAGGMAYVHDARRVWAIRMDDGAIAWTYPANASPRAPSARAARRLRQGRTGGRNASQVVGSQSACRRILPMLTSTFGGGRLFVVLTAWSDGRLSERPHPPRTILVCLDAAGGQELWRVGPEQLGQQFGPIEFGSSPLYYEGRLYAVVHSRTAESFEGCYLIQLDAATGLLSWQTHLASAPATGAQRHSTLTYPAIRGGSVFVHTNLGAVASVHAHTGRIRWLRLYPRIDPRLSPRSRPPRTRGLKPSHRNPTMCWNDHIVCYPLDSPAILVLRQSDGALARRIAASELFDAESILGVIEDQLFTVGRHVACWDLLANKLIWSRPGPELDLYGRGALTAGRVFLSALDGIYMYPTDGSIPRVREFRPGEQPGNLLVTPERILVAGRQSLACYAGKQEAFAHLQRRIDAAGNDPCPLLHLAEVAFREHEHSVAVEALDRAVRLAGGFDALAEPELKRRVFADCLAFGDAFGRLDPPQLDQALSMYLRAAQCAPEARAHVRCRLRLADLYTRRSQFTEAIGQYQQIIADRSLRDELIESGPPQPGEPEPAGAVAQRAVALILQAHGRHLYQPFEQHARSVLRAAREDGDASVLQRVADEYPNSLAAGEALLAWARLLREDDQHRLATRVLRRALASHARSIDAPTVMCEIAHSYAQTGETVAALGWLARAARAFPAATITVRGQRLTARQYRQQLIARHGKAGPLRPRIDVPFRKGYELQFPDRAHVLEPRFAASAETRWDVLITFSQSQLQAYDSSDGQALWNEPIECRIRPVLLAISRDGMIFATRYRIFRVDAVSGREIWSLGEYPSGLDDPHADPESFDTWLDHALHEDRLVSVRRSGKAVCLDAGNGRVIWERQLAPQLAGPLVLSEDLLAYSAMAARKNVVVVLDAETGTEQHLLATEDERPVLWLTLSAERSLIAANAQTIYAFDPDTPRRLWRVSSDETFRAATIRADFDGLYLSEDDQHVTKRRLTNGRDVWTSVVGGPSLSTPASLTVSLAAGRLYAGRGNDLLGFDVGDGRTAWAASIPQPATMAHWQVADPYVVIIEQRPAAAGTGASAFEYTASFHDPRGRSHAGPAPDASRVSPSESPLAKGVAARLGPHTGALSEPGVSQRLGTYARLDGVFLRDHALLLLDGQTIYGWVSREVPSTRPDR